MAAATEPVRAAAHTVEERAWRGSDWARDRAHRGSEWALNSLERARIRSEELSWPFERVTWLFERWVLWPIQRRISIPRHFVGAGALAALAVALVAFSVLTLGGDRSSPKPIAATARFAAPPSAPLAPTESSAKAVLRGATPSFGVGNGIGVGETAAEEAGTISTGETSAPAIGAEGEAATTSASDEPVPAGPSAMRVARRFSEAFVFYEIGKKPERTTAVFNETTSTRLATALEERPPRQPAGVQVPQARVLNLVPGPRSGSAYTVSASLLRLGVTSELRLELEKQNGDWVVTDVRG